MSGTQICRNEFLRSVSTFKSVVSISNSAETLSTLTINGTKNKLILASYTRIYIWKSGVEFLLKTLSLFRAFVSRLTYIVT
jgi:hypothetical protein